MKALFLFAVVQNHIETSRKRNDELVQILVGVAAALGPAGNIIEVINAFDVKGYVPPAFDEGEVAAWIADFRKVNNSAFGETHELEFSRLRVIFKRYCKAFVLAAKTGCIPLSTGLPRQGIRIIGILL